eukprot:COSAG02_NODE_1634_length_11565_cov_4.754666_1_plen_106_part_00
MKCLKNYTINHSNHRRPYSAHLCPHRSRPSRNQRRSSPKLRLHKRPTKWYFETQKSGIDATRLSGAWIRNAPHAVRLVLTKNDQENCNQSGEKSTTNVWSSLHGK